MTLRALFDNLFEPAGAHVLVDGQYGSTGKGALAAWLAKQACEMNIKFEGAVTSAGPNSGHTFYDDEGTKHVLKQLPTFSVVASRYGFVTPAYLSGGSVISLETLIEEAERYPDVPIFVHGCAAVIQPGDAKEEAEGTIGAIASTCSGTGIAQMRKISRNPIAIFRHFYGHVPLPPNVNIYWNLLRTFDRRFFVEVSQGYSLGINSFFYPHTTSRECTVMQGLADARIPARHAARIYMSIRTYPIRVGNLEGNSSGDWYDDQVEVKWEDIGITPELTTVTKRIRRVATFSEGQFLEACHVNDPNIVFINFLNYLPPEQRLEFIADMYRLRKQVPTPYWVLGGMGPYMKDIQFV